jgi:hypothetical protein
VLVNHAETVTNWLAPRHHQRFTTAPSFLVLLVYYPREQERALVVVIVNFHLAHIRY